MKTKIITIALVSLSFLSIDMYCQEIETKIIGEVVGRDSKEILLVPITEDFNNIIFLFKGISIPIKDNKFEYTLRNQYVEEYMLIFKEEAENYSYWPREVFNDSSIIKVIIYPDSISAKSSFQGGALNRIKQKRQKELYKTLEPLEFIFDSLYKTDRLYSKEYSDISNEIYTTSDEKQKVKLRAQLRSLKEMNQIYTPLGQKISNKMDSIWNNEKIWKENYIRNNDDPFAYSLLFKEVEGTKELDSAMESNYIRFAEKFPNHPYTEIINKRFETLKSIKIGGKYLDFTAPTVDGELVKLSDKIAGKVALINLWATWCSPCRAKAKSMIPVYDKYKDKGFTVVGVAGVYKDIDDFKIAIEKDKYPWLDLIEFNNQKGIWFKYGIAGNGGAIFMVDSTGKILAINPEPEEVEQILIDLLN